jgi:uncharacterized protein (DUF433 family)
MNWKDYIVEDQEVLMGKPTIKGTRISIEHLVNLFASGWTEEKILENYPRLTREHLTAVFNYIQECFKDGMMFNQIKTV